MHSLSNVTAVTGYLAACVIVGGGMQCWGNNWYGELGIGSTIDKSTPQQVVGLTSGVTAISAGDRQHVCAVASGAAKCWGWGENGKLGTGSLAGANTPQQVTGLITGVTAISAGSNHTCAIVSGAAKCWGGNSTGQLGDGSVVDSSVPVQVSGLTSGVTAITAGENNTCAIVYGGLKCWGQNPNGVLGSGLGIGSSAPVDVVGMSTGVTAVAMSRSITCAVVSGAAKCWGDNTNGLFGNGVLGAVNYFNVMTPQQIVGIDPITTTSTSSSTSTSTTTTVVARSSTTTVAVSVTTTAAPIAQGQSSIATIAPMSGTTTAVLNPLRAQTVQSTTTSIPAVVTSVANAQQPEAPNAPAASPGEAGATVDGKAVSAALTRSENQINVTAGGISAIISGRQTNDQRIELDADGNLRLNDGDRIVVEASGYVANEDVSVWLYSTPTRLGVVTADASGAITAAFDVPPTLDNGNHRLVLDGVNTGGTPVILSIGISYGANESGSSVVQFLIGIPLALAVLFGLFLPAVIRRRRENELAE
jgi:hypothetical protein